MLGGSQNVSLAALWCDDVCDGSMEVTRLWHAEAQHLQKRFSVRKYFVGHLVDEDAAVAGKSTKEFKVAPVRVLVSECTT